VSRSRHQHDACRTRDSCGTGPSITHSDTVGHDHAHSCWWWALPGRGCGGGAPPRSQLLVVGPAREAAGGHEHSWRLCARHFELSSKVLVILQSRAVRNSSSGSAALQRATNRNLRPRLDALDLPPFLDLKAHDTRTGADHSNAGRSSETSAPTCVSHAPWRRPRQHTSHTPLWFSAVSIWREYHWLGENLSLVPWQPVAPPCRAQSTFLTTISHFVSHMCFVSASCQTIAAFRRPVDRNLQRISRITPSQRLPDSAKSLLQGIGPRTAHQHGGLSMEK